MATANTTATMPHEYGLHGNRRLALSSAATATLERIATASACRDSRLVGATCGAIVSRCWSRTAFRPLRRQSQLRRTVTGRCSKPGKSGALGRQSRLFRVRQLGWQHGLYTGQQPSAASHTPAILSAAAELRVLITGSLVDWPLPDPRARHDDLQVAEAQREPLVLVEHIGSSARLACRQLVRVRVRVRWKSVG